MKFLEVTTDAGKLAIRPQYVHRILAETEEVYAIVVTSDREIGVHETYAELIQQLEGIQ